MKMTGTFDKGEFLAKENLDNLVSNSMFFHYYGQANHETLGGDIARMTFYASSEVFSGMHIALEKEFRDQRYNSSKDVVRDCRIILSELHIADIMLTEMWNDYKEKTNFKKHLSKFSWINDTNMHLGEKLGSENNLLTAYIINSAGQDYLIQSKEDNDKGYFKIAGEGRNVAKSLGYAAQRLKTMETFLR